MSERQELRRLLGARIAYALDIERWAQKQPPRIRFLAVRRWLKEMPRKENYFEVVRFTVTEEDGRMKK